MKKINKTPLAAAMGVAFISTFAVTAANAEANLFGISELSQGYMQVAEAEMKCGANMKMDDSNAKMPEGACAGKKAADAKPADATATDAKAPEASCGNMMKDGKMKAGMEASCGEMMKGKEGSCGMMQGDAMKGKEGAATDATAKAPEASCGGMMENGKMKAGMEASCGAMMKGKEGACGMMSSGDTMKSKEGSCGAAMKAPEDKTAGTANKPSSGTKIVPYVPAAK